MRNKYRKALIATAAVVLLIAVSWLWWVQSMDYRLKRQADRVTRSNFAELAMGEWESALRDEGTNAIPVLIGWIHSYAKPESRLQRSFREFRNRFQIFTSFGGSDEAAHRAYLASHSFHVFGTNAAWAVPALREIARARPGGAVEERALEAIRGIGVDL